MGRQRQLLLRHAANIWQTAAKYNQILTCALPAHMPKKAMGLNSSTAPSRGCMSSNMTMVPKQL